MSHNKMYFGFFLVFFVAIAIMIILFKVQKNPYVSITNYDECVKAGYRVTVSDISQCALPSGKIFVNPFVPER